MRYLPASDGVSLAVHEHGGHGRPTLFCHATGLHGAVWEPLSAALDPELRAMGASTSGATEPPWCRRIIRSRGPPSVTTPWPSWTTSGSSPGPASGSGTRSGVPRS